jgi:hypothetical protein
MNALALATLFNASDLYIYSAPMSQLRDKKYLTGV